VIRKSFSRHSRTTLSAVTTAATAAVIEALEIRRCLSASLDGDGVLTIRGTAGQDMIDVGVYAGRLWVDEVWGGSETFNLADVHGVRIEGGAGDDLLTVSEWTNEFPLPVTIVGGDGNDTLMGGAQDDVLLGGAGEDTLLATYQPWTLAGLSLDGAVQVGDDLLLGGSGGDVLDGAGTDGNFTGDAADWGSAVFHDGYLILRGTGGDDTITTMRYNDGQTLHVEVDWGKGGVAWNLDASVVKGVIVYGAEGNDTIAVDADYDAYLTPVSIYGGAGDDTIVGGSADDVLVGGSGDDAIDGGAGGVDTIEQDGGDYYTAAVPTPSNNTEDVTPADEDQTADDGETAVDHGDEAYALPPSVFGTTPIGKDDHSDDALWA
jgi:Ca2+-binding RTX toxin-like protein